MNSIQILNGGDSEKLKRIWGLIVNSQVPFWIALSPEKEKKKLTPKWLPWLLTLSQPLPAINLNVAQRVQNNSLSLCFSNLRNTNSFKKERFSWTSNWPTNSKLRNTHSRDSSLILQKKSFNHELSVKRVIFMTCIIPFLSIKIKIQISTILKEIKIHSLKMNSRSRRNPFWETALFKTEIRICRPPNHDIFCLPTHTSTSPKQYLSSSATQLLLNNSSLSFFS